MNILQKTDMKRTVIHALAAITVLVAGLSCTKESLELEYTRQEDNIDKYITNLLKQDTTMRVTYNGGASRVTLKAGEGPALADGNNVSFFWGGYIFTNNFNKNNLFQTNDIEQAKASGWDTSDESRFQVLNINLGEYPMIEGLRNGLVGVKEGEECYIIFSGKRGFGNRSVGRIPSNSALLYYVKVQFVGSNQ